MNRLFLVLFFSGITVICHAAQQSETKQTLDEAKLVQWLTKLTSCCEQEVHKRDSWTKDELTGVITGICKASTPSGLPQEIEAMALDLYIHATMHLVGIEPAALDLCLCHPMVQRILFTIKLVYEIKRTYNPQDKLIYVSVASGHLLQDYMLVRALLRAGYTKLQLHLIDMWYPDMVLMPFTGAERDAAYKKLEYAFGQIKEKRKKLERLQEYEERVEATCKYFTFTESIERFALHVAMALSQMQEAHHEIQIIVHDHARCCAAHLEQAHVMSMVDPSEASWTELPAQQKDFSTRANVFKQSSGTTIRLQGEKGLDPVSLASASLYTSVWLDFYDLVKHKGGEKTIVAAMYNNWPRKNDPIQMFFADRQTFLARDWPKVVQQTTDC